MPSTIAEVDKLFAAGAESVTLTRAEWEAICEISDQYSANGLEVSRAKREMERVSWEDLPGDHPKRMVDWRRLS
jgi:hypothetical protein